MSVGGGRSCDDDDELRRVEFSATRLGRLRLGAFENEVDRGCE